MEDRVGDRRLADVVQRRGVAQTFDPLVAEVEGVADGVGQVGDSVDVHPELRIALGEHLEQCAGGLAVSGRADLRLAGVEALVSQP